MAEGWHVTGQRQFEDLTPMNTFESFVEVTFALASGTLGSIKVPARLYSEDYVRNAIQERATTMMAIESL